MIHKPAAMQSKEIQSHHRSIPGKTPDMFFPLPLLPTDKARTGHNNLFLHVSEGLNDFTTMPIKRTAGPCICLSALKCAYSPAPKEYG